MNDLYTMESVLRHLESRVARKRIQREDHPDFSSVISIISEEEKVSVEFVFDSDGKLARIDFHNYLGDDSE